jgi:hypothetical protein
MIAFLVEILGRNLAQLIAKLPSTAICNTGWSARAERTPAAIVETTSSADPAGSNAPSLQGCAHALLVAEQDDAV